MMRTIFYGALALGLLSCGAFGPAQAQVVSDPNAIRACLCEEQFVLGLQDQLNTQRQALDAAQKNQATLTNQVETRRAQINVYDNAELDAFKQLLEQRDAAIAANATATQSYNAVAGRYNEAVAGYNGSCAGRTYDETVLRSVRTTLACPRPTGGP
jgi:hypothetical protein